MTIDVIPSAALAADAAATPQPPRLNLVVWVMTVIPLIAVVASIGLVLSSLREAEPALQALKAD